MSYKKLIASYERKLSRRNKIISACGVCVIACGIGWSMYANKDLQAYNPSENYEEIDNTMQYYYDSDGDGVMDVDDVCPGFDDTVDSNGDGVPDDCEVSGFASSIPITIPPVIELDFEDDASDYEIYYPSPLDPIRPQSGDSSEPWDFGEEDASPEPTEHDYENGYFEDGYYDYDYQSGDASPEPTEDYYEDGFYDYEYDEN